MTKSSTQNKLKNQLIGWGIFTGLTLGVISIFLNAFAPKPYLYKEAGFSEYDSSAMHKALALPELQKDHAIITGFGSRYSGQEGCSKTAELIQERMTASGLDVHTLMMSAVIPVTDRAKITDTELKIYPFYPNFLQPMNSPVEGLSGTLTLVSEKSIFESKGLKDQIALIDLSAKEVDGYGLNWVNYARIGFKAIILYHPDGMENAKWTTLEQMNSDNPVNYVRVMAESKVAALIGKKITLHVNTHFEQIQTPLIIGHLKSLKKNSKAMFIGNAYDASSYLPDLAPGHLPAVNTANFLRTIEGLTTYRENLKRDVFFLAYGNRVAGMKGMWEFMQLLGAKGSRHLARETLVLKQKENNEKSRLTTAALKLFANEKFAVDANFSREAVNSLDLPGQTFFDAELKYVLNTFVYNLNEPLIQARINLNRVHGEANSPEFKIYQTAKRRYDTVFSQAGFKLDKIVGSKSYEKIKDLALPKELEARFRALEKFHAEKKAFYSTAIKVHDLARQYTSTISIFDDVLPALEVKAAKQETSVSPGDVLPTLEVVVANPEISFNMGKEMKYGDEQALSMFNFMNKQVLQHKLEASVSYFGARKHYSTVQSRIQQQAEEGYCWEIYSYPGFNLYATNRAKSYEAVSSPTAMPIEWTGMDELQKFRSEYYLSLAFGNANFADTKLHTSMRKLGGKVFLGGIGKSLIPSYYSSSAVISARGGAGRPGGRSQAGRYATSFLGTDIYGQYEYVGPEAGFALFNEYKAVNPVAAVYGNTNNIQYIKDEGTIAQSVFKSVDVPWTGDINLVLFRANAVTVLDMINPQSMKAYAGITLIRNKGLVAFPKTFTTTDGGINTSFISPEERFYMKFQAGSATNKEVRVTRAFALNTSDADLAKLKGKDFGEVKVGQELVGQGYLVADHPIVYNISEEIARSMIFINAKRLSIQNTNQYEMADAQTMAFQDKSEGILHGVAADDLTDYQRTEAARNAVTYATQNHPILQGNISEAVWGILWYLGLLVPFAFFFEKLVFGFSDIRKQLTAHSIIFLSVFLALWVLHPAFAMIRSSFMVLLGFIIILISSMIIVLFCAKFGENLDEIRSLQGKVKSAKANKLGVITTAFLLGLNNMHRRRVRTGLTCATLVLLTFVMISFTSTQSNVIETKVGIGKAPFNGLLVKPQFFESVSDQELSALQAKYGRDYKVLPRKIMIGAQDYETKERSYPQLNFEYKNDQQTNLLTLKSIVSFSVDDPIQNDLKIVTQTKWFTREMVDDKETDHVPILISLESAQELGVTVDMVNANPVDLILNGGDVRIIGLFDADSLDNLQDLDGNSYLPYDIMALRTLTRVGGGFKAEDDDPKILARDVIIAPVEKTGIKVPGTTGSEMILSIAVLLPADMPYKQANTMITRYLEQSGTKIFYGLDGFAFQGQIARETDYLAGMLDMIIPLFIAALTVLNTMKSSVYERKDEIFVYNAVGISPNMIFFIFFAEAFVYSVVGSVLGFILSQGMGRILTIMEWTGGMNMTYTSIMTVIVSIIIMLCVFIASWLPALTAKKIASASDEQGWKMPESIDDTLTIFMPFTLSRYDRIAILTFFQRFFINNGPGSSGAFFCGAPEVGISSQTDPLDNGSYSPEIATTIWLKPFDLGVSQKMTITIKMDEVTREYSPVVVMERLSGTKENWLYLNEKFVRIMRRHFLEWRAVNADEKAPMHTEAKETLTQNMVTSNG